MAAYLILQAIFWGVFTLALVGSWYGQAPRREDWVTFFVVFAQTLWPIWLLPRAWGS